MNPRTFLNFFKTKTGQVTAFGLLFFVAACLLTGVLYFRHSKTATTTTLVAPRVGRAEAETVLSVAVQICTFLTGLSPVAFADSITASKIGLKIAALLPRSYFVLGTKSLISRSSAPSSVRLRFSFLFQSRLFFWQHVMCVVVRH